MSWARGMGNKPIACPCVVALESNHASPLTVIILLTKVRVLIGNVSVK